MRDYRPGWPWVIAALLSLALAVSCRPVTTGLAPGPDGAGEEKYSNPPRAVTATGDLHLTGSPPDAVDIAAYRLEIDGLVESPLSLTYEDILAYPAVTEVVLLICPGVFQDNAEWTGVPVWRLLKDAGLKAEATDVVFHAMRSPSSSPYTARLPLDEITGNDSIFLAYIVNGETLPLEHGYPLRLVAKDELGYNWVKWVDRLVVE